MRAFIFTRLLLFGSLFLPFFVFSAHADPYLRIVIAHRMVDVAHKKSLVKLENCKEPLKSELLKEFSKKNIHTMFTGVLKAYVSEKESEPLAVFLESAEGQKLVQYGYGVYDINKMTKIEKQRVGSFMKTDAGKAYSEFANEGMEVYLRLVRVRTEAVVKYLEEKH